MNRILSVLVCIFVVANGFVGVNASGGDCQKPILGMERIVPTAKNPFGIVKRILILPSNPTINEDQRIQFQAYGFDDKGNELEDSPSWRVEGVGQISSTGLYSPDKTGTATVFAQIQDKYVSTSVTIKPKGSTPQKSINQWPMFGRNTYRTSFIEDSYGPQTRNVVPIWSRETKKPVNNSMVYGNDRLFAGSGDGNYDIVNPVTGECNARIVSEKYSFDTAVLAGDTIIVASYSNPYVICFDYIRDKIVWQAVAGPLNSELLYSGGAILFSTTNFRFLCLSADKGKFLWGFDTGKEIWSSPACSDSKYFVGTDKNTFICFDGKTKKTTWKVEICGGLKYPPVVGKDKVYFSAFNEKECRMYCYSIANGQLCWEYKIDRAIVASPALSPDKVCYTSLDGKIYCLDAAKGNLLWSYATNDEIYCSPVIYGQKVIFGSDDHFVRCVDMTDGILVWELETKEAIRSSPIVYNGFVYVASMDKHVYCLADFDDNIASIEIEPFDVTLRLGQTQKYSAKCKNQFGQIIRDSKIVWSVKGLGSITQDGLFTSGQTPGIAYIKAESGKMSTQSVARIIDQVQYDSLCSDWTMFGKDERNTKLVNGICVPEKVKSMSIIWSKKLDAFSMSNPIVKGSYFYYATNIGQVMCLDKTTGETKWSVESGRNPNTTMLFYENMLYYGTVEGTMECISALDGLPKWSFEISNNQRIKTKSVRSSPIFKNGRIIFGTTNGFVYCLNPNDGSVIWSYDTYQEVSGVKGAIELNIDSAVACSSEYVYFGSFNKYFYCLKLDNGESVWKRYIGSTIYASPLVSNGYVYFGAKDGYVYNLNASNGNIVWKYKTGKQIWSTPTLAGNMIYVGSDDERLYCLNALTGDFVWKSAQNGWIHSSPVVAKDRLYIGTHGKKVVCIDISDGKIIARHGFIGTISSIPIISDGMLYVSSQNSELVCLKLE